MKVKRRPLKLEIIEEAGVRLLVATYSDGEVVRETVVPKKGKPPRRGYRPSVRLKDRTRKKQF